MKKEQLKSLLKHIINEVKSIEETSVPRKWYKERDLLLMTPQQRVVVDKLRSQKYEITSIVPSEKEEGKIDVVLDQSASAGFRGANIVQVKPDGSVDRNDGIKEDMTTRAELDSGLMKAVNVETLNPPTHPTITGLGILVGTMAARNIKDLVKRKLANKKLNKASKEKKNVKSEMIVGSEQTFLDKVKQRKQLRENFEGEKIYKDRQGGNDVYWIYSTDEGRKIFIKPESVNYYIKRGYRLIDLADADKTNEETGTGAVAGYSAPVAYSRKKLEEGKIQDPTKEEMIKYLQHVYSGLLHRDHFNDAAEVAIYWFANDYHGGQSSNLYSVLSTSPFKPGSISKGPEKDSIESDMYTALEGEFGGKNLKEMTSTGAVAGYMTPYSFAKSKEGSPKAIQAAKKYGKVVKSIAKEEQ
jgi:hypothetical protein